MIVKMKQAEKHVFLNACRSFGIPIFKDKAVYPHNVVRCFGILRDKTEVPEMLNFVDMVIRNAEICQQAEQMMVIKT